MKDIFNQLITRYKELMEERKQLGEDNADIEKVVSLLNEMMGAGKYIADPEKRSIISNIAIDLGDIIFESSDEDYPSVRLDPLEHSTNTVKSLKPNVTAFLILTGAMIVAGYTGISALFSTLKRYSKVFEVFIIYAGFVEISLIAALVMFGIIQTTGIFKNKNKKGRYEFGGTVAGFIATLIFLIGAYQFFTPTPSVLQIAGNVRFVEAGKPVGPLVGANVALSKYSGFETKTDVNGNFIIKFPTDQKYEEIELQIIYITKTFYWTIKLTDMENVIIEIERSQLTPQLIGNVRFVEAGKPVGPVIGANVVLSKFSGFETKTDVNGNFTISNLPTDQKIEEIEIQIEFIDKTYYYTIKPADMENVTIEIEREKGKDEEYLRKNISGKWKYSSPFDDKNFNIWTIVQNDDNIDITGEDYQINFIGQYSYITGNFSYTRKILFTNNSFRKETGTGKIDVTGNIIIGTVTSHNFSDSFILERILE